MIYDIIGTFIVGFIVLGCCFPLSKCRQTPDCVYVLSAGSCITVCMCIYIYIYIEYIYIYMHINNNSNYYTYMYIYIYVYIIDTYVLHILDHSVVYSKVCCMTVHVVMLG